MLYGEPSFDRSLKTPATPRASAFCPLCGQELIAKCGSIVSWHWAHKQRAECDPWSENEGEWHRSWKRYVPPECCEVTIKRDGVHHRADILIPNGGPVVELQHSPISEAVVREREGFYGDMLWLFDATAFADQFDIKFHVYKRKMQYNRNSAMPWLMDVPTGTTSTDNLYRWRWKKPRWSILSTQTTLLFDFGAERPPDHRIFLATGHMEKDYNETALRIHAGGYGSFLNIEKFINYLRTGINTIQLPKKVRKLSGIVARCPVPLKPGYFETSGGGDQYHVFPLWEETT